MEVYSVEEIKEFGTESDKLAFVLKGDCDKLKGESEERELVSYKLAKYGRDKVYKDKINLLENKIKKLEKELKMRK